MFYTSVLISFNELNKGFMVLTLPCFYDSRRNSFASLSQNGLSHSLSLALTPLASVSLPKYRQSNEKFL